MVEAESLLIPSFVMMGFLTVFGVLVDSLGYLTINAPDASVQFWTMIWTAVLGVASVISLVIVAIGIIVAVGQLSQARRDQRVKYTDTFISQAVSSEARAAHLKIVPRGMNVRQGHDLFTRNTNAFRAAKYDLEGPNVDREYIEAIGFYANLYLKVALYHQKGLLDFDLWAPLEALNLTYLSAMMNSDFFCDLRATDTPGTIPWLARQAYRYSLNHNPALVDNLVRVAFGDAPI